MSNERFISRWGDTVLDDEGYIRIPGFIMRWYNQFKDRAGMEVGLSAQEFTFMCHVMSFKYDSANSEARPSLYTVAERMGRDVSNVRDYKKSLVDKGAMTAERQQGDDGEYQTMPSVYNFRELVRQCLLLELEAQGSGENTSPPAGEITSPGVVKTPDEDLKIIPKDKEEKEVERKIARPSQTEIREALKRSAGDTGRSGDDTETHISVKDDRMPEVGRIIAKMCDTDQLTTAMVKNLNALVPMKDGTKAQSPADLYRQYPAEVKAYLDDFHKLLPIVHKRMTPGSCILLLKAYEWRVGWLAWQQEHYPMLGKEVKTRPSVDRSWLRKPKREQE